MKVMAVFNLWPQPGDDDTPRPVPEYMNGNVELFESKAAAGRALRARVLTSGGHGTNYVYHDGNEWMVEPGWRDFPNVDSAAHVDIYTDFAAMLEGEPVRVGFYQLGPRGGAVWRKS